MKKINVTAKEQKRIIILSIMAILCFYCGIVTYFTKSFLLMGLLIMTYLACLLSIGTILDKVLEKMWTGVVCAFGVGICLVFFGCAWIGWNNSYRESHEIKQVKVVEIRGNTIVVDESFDNLGDHDTKEMKKPFFFSEKKGDIISVTENGQKIKYVRNRQWGEKVTNLGSHILLFVTLISLALIPTLTLFYAYTKVKIKEETSS